MSRYGYQRHVPIGTSTSNDAHWADALALTCASFRSRAYAPAANGTPGPPRAGREPVTNRSTLSQSSIIEDVTPCASRSLVVGLVSSHELVAELRLFVSTGPNADRELRGTSMPLTSGRILGVPHCSSMHRSFGTNASHALPDCLEAASCSKRGVKRCS